MFSIVIYLLEDGMALEQLRILVLLWINSLIHTMSVGVGPVKTFGLLYVVSIKPFETVRATLA